MTNITKLTSLIQKDRIRILSGSTKDEAITDMIELIASTSKIKDIESIKEAISYREKLMSTGIGLGIGIPHIRSNLTEEPIVALGVCRKGLSDYESIDGQPVRIIVMIITGRAQHKQHIKILSNVVSFFKRGIIREELDAAMTVDDIWNALAKG